MFRPVIFLVCSLFFSFALRSQVDSVYTGHAPEAKKENAPRKQLNTEWKEKVTWGGNFQAWIGNPTFILLSPTVGYLVHKNVNVGLGLIYNYTEFRTPYGKFAQSIWGGHSYARYIIANSYFLQVQYDKLSQPDFLSLDPNKKRWVDYILVGGGFRQAIADKAALTASIMYNVKPDPLSIYPSRVIVQFGVVGTF